MMELEGKKNYTKGSKKKIAIKKIKINIEI